MKQDPKNLSRFFLSAYENELVENDRDRSKHILTAPIYGQRKQFSIELHKIIIELCGSIFDMQRNKILILRREDSVI